ncbi:MAG: PorT family protein [Muribaculaceae bacterium]|nr:PorT family protein [Muribaculaceae bacterium]
MRKRYLISALLAVAAALPSLAQSTIFSNPSNRAYFGVRAGVDITSPGAITIEDVSLDVFKNGAGFEFGGIYNIPIVANFYIEPGLKLFFSNYSIKDDFVHAMEDDIIYDAMSIHKFGMRVPVLAGYHFDFTPDIRVSIFTGPELQIGFKGDLTIKSGNSENSSSIFGDDGVMSRFNLLWGIGAGVEWRHICFNVNGGIGIINTLRDSGPVTLRENHLTLSLGYNF